VKPQSVTPYRSSTFDSPIGLLKLNGTATTVARGMRLIEGSRILRPVGTCPSNSGGAAAMPPFSRSRVSMMKWLRRGMGMHCASRWASGCGSSIYLVPGTFCCWNSLKP